MERGRMAGRSRRDYLRVMWQRYQRGDRAERSALLDEVTRVCGYHRESVIRLFCRVMPPERRVRRGRVAGLTIRPWSLSGWRRSGPPRAICVRRG